MYFLIKQADYLVKQNERMLDYIVSNGLYPALIDVTKYKKNRTLAQNRLLWKWLDIISDNTGEDKEDLHDRLRQKLGLYRDEICMDKHGNNIVIRVLIETRRMDVKRFSEYLDHVQRLGVFLGLQLPIPDDYKFIMTGQK